MKHGLATIQQPVIFPSGVSPNTPFDIIYTIKNTGKVADKLWGHITVNGNELPLSKWSKNIPVNGTVTATYHHTGISTTTTFKIEAGY